MRVLTPVIPVRWVAIYSRLPEDASHASARSRGTNASYCTTVSNASDRMGITSHSDRARHRLDPATAGSSDHKGASGRIAVTGGCGGATSEGATPVSPCMTARALSQGGADSDSRCVDGHNADLRNARRTSTRRTGDRGGLRTPERSPARPTASCTAGSSAPAASPIPGPLATRPVSAGASTGIPARPPRLCASRTSGSPRPTPP